MQENQEKNNEQIILNTSEEHTSSNISIEDTAKEAHKKIEKKKTLIIIVFSVLVFLILLISLILLFIHFKGLKEYTYNEEYPIYQYFSGIKSIYTGKITLSSEDSITKIESNEGVSNISDAPIYFQDIKNQVLTTKNMLLVIPRLVNENYKIKEFSKITYDAESENIFYEIGKNKIPLEESVLYDGSNLYLFLANTSVDVCGSKYDLSPLSYAIVNYKDQVEVYDVANDKYHMIDVCDKDVIATMSSSQINLSTDMVNNDRLLLKSIDNLPIYKK